MKGTAFYLKPERRSTLTFDYRPCMEPKIQYFRIIFRGLHAQLPIVVLAVDCLLATGSSGFGVISVRLVVAFALPNCGHRGGRSSGVAEGDPVSSSARTSRSQSLTPALDARSAGIVSRRKIQKKR